MKCDYDGREIEGEPLKVKMKKRGMIATAAASKPLDGSAQIPEIDDSYFHDKTCYELFVADESEYEALDLPGNQIG